MNNTFTIDNENTITAFAAHEDALNFQVGEVEHFDCQKALSKLAAAWLPARLTEIWNSFAGVVPFDELKPVKKFTDRKTAVARIWKAIQRLTPAPAQHAAPVATKKAKAAKGAKKKDAAPVAREGSKKAIVIELLKRPEGATLEQIMDETSWQAHSVRGFISGNINKKMGLAVESSKSKDGDRIYRITK